MLSCRPYALVLVGLLLVSSCGTDVANDVNPTGSEGDAGAVTNPRSGRPAPAGATPSTSSGNLNAPDIETPAETDGEPETAPAGGGIYCSDSEGYPVCCNGAGECWERGIPDDTGAPLDGSTWELVLPSASPPARKSHALVYDPLREVVVLFGGRGDGADGYYADTWEYDGQTWVEVSGAAAPSSRRNHALAYDEARQRVVLFGGWNEQVLGDTWEYDGTGWTEITTARSPSNRDSYGLAYDRARGRVVLFGGYEAARLMGDTWEYDGDNWTKISTEHAPTARRTHTMAYDDARGRVVLFGGLGGDALSAGPGGCKAEGGNQVFDDVWEYDGVDWVAVATPVAPRARTAHGMTYDSVRQRMVLFGGFDGACTGVFLGDTWEYSDGTWTPTGPATKAPRNFGHALAFDAARERVVLFGGYGSEVRNDTWEYTGP